MEALDGLWSPQLIALQQQFQEGERSALTAFRERLQVEGTPLVEPFGTEQFLVTVLWLDLEARLLPGELTCALGGILNSRKMAFPLLHLADSGLWYRTYSLPSQVRATYHFFLNGEAVADPLSHLPFAVPASPVSVYGEHELKLAVVELPDAAPDRWSQLRPDIARGRLQSQLMFSSITGHDYRLSTYLPPDYRDSEVPYPLLLLYDEWSYTQVVPTPIILDNMLADGLIPPLVAVLFGHIRREDRMREMGFYEPFFTCVAEELLPHVYEHYHVTREPARTIVAGASMGGLAAVYSALRYPEHFGNVYSHTASFQAGPPSERAYQRLERELMTRPHLPQHFYLDVGMLERDEMGYGLPDGGLNALECNRIVRDLLRSQGYQVTYCEYPGAHDLLWAATTLVDALKTLIPLANHT